MIFCVYFVQVPDKALEPFKLMMGQLNCLKNFKVTSPDPKKLSAKQMRKRISSFCIPCDSLESLTLSKGVILLDSITNRTSYIKTTM